MQLLKELLLWFSKYLSTSSVVSIKGTWADIKAPSRIIYPWQPDCTFHLKCEAELQCRNETANLQPGPRQLLTEMATLGFTCKMWWDVYNLIKGTCIILVKMWEIERKKKTLYKCIRQRLQKSYFWCFSLTWWGLIMHPLSKMRSVQLTCYCFLFLLFLFQVFF